MIIPATTVSRVLALLLVGLFFSCRGVAQGQCNQVLQKTDVARLDSAFKKEALLYSIDSQGAWEASKSIGGGLKAIYEDIPLEATGNYSDFSKWRTSMISSLNYSLTSDETHRLVTSFLPSDAIEAWQKCMAGEEGGLEVSATNITADHLDVIVYWIPPPLNKKETIPRPLVTGGHIVGPWPLPETVTESTKIPLTFLRDKNEDFRLTIKIAKWAPTLLIPADEQAKKECSFELGNNSTGTPFLGVAVNPDTGVKWTAICSGLSPGAKANAVVSGLFRIDDPKGLWLRMQASLNNGSQVLMEYGTSADKGSASPHQLTGVTDSTVVPWDGIVTLCVLAIRAQHDWNIQSTISALPGTTAVVRTY